MQIKKFGPAALVMLAVAAAAGQASAQSDEMVTLKSFDGFTQLRGEIVDFNGFVYIIDTAVGRLEVDAMQVNCEGPACPETLLFGAEFGIHGADTIADGLMPALIEGYGDTINAELVMELGADAAQRTIRMIHPNGEEMAAIDVAALNPDAAYEDLANGAAAIAMADRRMTDASASVLAAAGYGDLRNSENEIIVAVDGLAIIVHPDNPVRTIATREIAGIFSGEIRNWSELGGRDLPISIYSQPEGFGARATLEELVLEPQGAALTAAAVEIADDPERSDKVATDPGGISFVGFAFIRAARALPIRQECGLLSYPTEFGIKTDEYPLSRRLYLYTTGQGTPAHAQRLIDFATSDEAAPYIEDAGFTSLVPETEGLRNQGMRLAHALTVEEDFSLEAMRRMLAELKAAERLSTTFRFRPGSSNLTAQSEEDAARLARAIAGGDFAGKQVMLIGFTDSIGQFELNRRLSQRRAEGVRETMANIVGEAALARADIAVRGYGELTPVGCNTTFDGRVTNRRIEVWVR